MAALWPNPSIVYLHLALQTIPSRADTPPHSVKPDAWYPETGATESVAQDDAGNQPKSGLSFCHSHPGWSLGCGCRQLHPGNVAISAWLEDTALFLLQT